VLAPQPRLESLVLLPTLPLHTAPFVGSQALFVKVPAKTGLQSQPAAPAKVCLLSVFVCTGRSDGPTSGLMVESLTTRSLKDDY
jgi:hypothetical protein